MFVPETEKYLRKDGVQFDRWASFTMNVGRKRQKTWIIATDEDDEPRTAWHRIVAVAARKARAKGLPNIKWTFTRRPRKKESGTWFTQLGGTIWGYAKERPYCSLQQQREKDPETPLFIVVTRYRRKRIEYGNGGCLPKDLKDDLNSYSMRFLI